MAIKEELDRKVEEHEKMIKYLENTLPHFFRNSAIDTENRKAFVPIEQGADGKSWRSTINLLQIEAKDMLSELLNGRQAFAEAFRELVAAYSELRKGYDIQGRALLALCKINHISFDKLVEVYTNDDYSMFELKKEEEPQEEDREALLKEVEETLPF